MINTSYTGLTKDFIMDGKLMLENLKDAKLSEEWLYQQLQQQNITIKEVFTPAWTPMAIFTYRERKNE